MGTDWHVNRDDAGWKDYWRSESPDTSSFYTSVQCIGIIGDGRAQIDVDVSIEQSFKFNVNGVHITTFLTSPRELEELAAGFLLCEGFVDSPDEIICIELHDDFIVCDIVMDTARFEQVRMQQSTGTESLSPVKSTICFEVKDIFNAIDQLKVRGKAWRRTGGTHSSMICDSSGNILTFSEDVSRACSVDKAVGKAVLKGIDPANCALLTTGRLSATMVAKAARAGFPLIASKSAPLSEGIRLADEVGMSLVAFARKPDLYVYTGAHRVI